MTTPTDAAGGMTEQERGQFILRLAMALMANGKARSWSHALEQARKLAGNA